jgi:hypothetical protein
LRIADEPDKRTRNRRSVAESAPLDSADVPVINIDGAQGRQIERAYGSSLSPTVRAEIIKATEALAFLHSFELTAERFTKVKIILEAHEKAATRLFNELFVGPSTTSDAGVYAHVASNP